MNKNSIKKLIISIVFIVFLIMFFLVGKNINDNKNIKKISIVKNIVKEKYDKVFFDKESKYLYTLKKDDGYIYSVFDLHGNKLYNINSKNELNIIKVMKKYYIVYDEKYHLYTSDNEEITSGSVIEGINEYLIKVDNNIINYNNETVFKDVHSIIKYSDDNYLNINNYYLTNKKGDILLENVVVFDEVKKYSITDYLIIKKDKKYYTFFIKLDRIIGDGFDSYSINDKTLLINNDDVIYKIYRTGLRKKIRVISKKIKNNYYLKNEYLMENKIFAVKKSDNSFGIIDLNTNKFTRITKINPVKIKKIDKNSYLIKTKDNSIVYDINKNKELLSTKLNFDSIVIFKNGYKTIKYKDAYTLLDKEDKIVYNSDKQIIIDNPVISGKVNKTFYLYEVDKKIKKKYYKIKYTNDTYYLNKDKLYNSAFNLKYNSDLFLFTRESVIYKKNNVLYFYNNHDKKEYNYELINNEEVINNTNEEKILLLESDKYVKILDEKGNVLKKINNVKIIDYYTTKHGNIIIITCTKDIDGVYYGSYLAE